MIALARPTTRRLRQPDPPPATCHVVCVVCRAGGPPVSWPVVVATREPDETRAEREAERLAAAAGWVQHDEPCRTPTGRRRAQWVIQYFCPNCVGRVGTIEARDPPRRR